MQKINLPISIDTEDIQKQINAELKKRFSQEIGYRLNMLFINPKKELEYNAIKKFNNNDPDISVGYNFIKDSIDKRILDDNFQNYINNYIDENFKKYLDEALDTAMKHKANSMAFKAIKKDINLNG